MFSKDKLAEIQQKMADARAGKYPERPVAPKRPGIGESAKAREIAQRVADARAGKYPERPKAPEPPTAWAGGSPDWLKNNPGVELKMAGGGGVKRMAGGGMNPGKPKPQQPRRFGQPDMQRPQPKPRPAPVPPREIYPDPPVTPVPPQVTSPPMAAPTTTIATPMPREEIYPGPVGIYPGPDTPTPKTQYYDPYFGNPVNGYEADNGLLTNQLSPEKQAWLRRLNTPVPMDPNNPGGGSRIPADGFTGYKYSYDNNGNIVLSDQYKNWLNSEQAPQAFTGTKQVGYSMTPEYLDYMKSGKLNAYMTSKQTPESAAKNLYMQDIFNAAKTGYKGLTGNAAASAYAKDNPFKFAKGGKVGAKKWEGSKKDEAQDKKLAKKHGMSMKKWEKSSMDKKHDTQKSMKGLKKGGVSAYAKGGGIESKGKTKAKAVKMCGGGMKGYAGGGAISAKKADGIASRGRTKCKIC